MSDPSLPEYVETYDEPHHRRRFENAFARAYDVLIPPGTRTLYHRHTEDTFYVSVVAARPREQALGGEPSAPFDLPAGVGICRNHRSEPLIHQVTNTGETDMRMIGVEVKASPGFGTAEMLDVPGHQLVWEQERLRNYRISLDPGGSTGEIDYPFAGITVALSQASLLVQERGGVERTVTVEAGDVVWHAAPTTTSIENVGEAPYSAFLAEWR